MRVTVYAGSSADNTRGLREGAARFGRELAESGAEIAYGVGRLGLMRAVADAALGAGGTVIGVIPESPAAAEIAPHELSRLHVVPDREARRRLLWELGDCFVALPGSLRALEELFESWMHLVLGQHAKPVMLLNHQGYWDPMNSMLDRMAACGFARGGERRSLVTVPDAAGLFDVVARWTAPAPRWLSRS